MNEILAANVENLLDADDSAFDDWIELYNATDAPIDLGGWYLTDKPDKEPKKWAIPKGTTIPARGYLVVWADEAEAPKSGLHANFSLAQSGEAVGLFNAQGVAIDSVTFGAQTADVSVGRVSDAADALAWFSNPSPGKANGAGAAATQQAIAGPDFSLTAGFYPSAQLLKLTTTVPGARVAYTTDGTTPKDTTRVSQAEVSITKTTVVRARVFKDGGLPSSVITRSYLINEDTTLPVVSIATNPANLYDKDIGIWTNYLKEDWERPIHIEYFGADRALKFSHGAGIEIHGSTSRALVNKALALRARDKYGAGKFSYKFFDDKDVKSFTSLVLRASGQDQTSTMLRDGTMHSVVRGQMDLDTQGYQPALMFLNGEYWGVRNIREKVNKYYPESNYGVKSGDVEDVEVGEGANGDHYKALIEYVRTHDMTLAASLDYVATQMDVDEYINYMLTEIYFGNFDWPGTNVEIWRENKAGKKWRWILKDLDNAMGLWENQYGFDFDFLAFALNTAPTADPYWPNPPWSTLLFRKLMENPVFKARFAQRMAGHISTTFEPSRVAGFVNRFRNLIAAEMPDHIAKWKDTSQTWYIQNATDWQKQVDAVVDFANKRPAFARQHLLNHVGANGQSRGFATLSIVNAQPEKGQVYVENVKIPQAVNFSGDWLMDLPMTLKAVPAAGKRFLGWSGSVTGTAAEISLTMTGPASLTALFGD